MKKNIQQKGSGSTHLVFVHGNSSSGHSFTDLEAEILNQFKGIYTSWTFDLPGHGQGMVPEKDSDYFFSSLAQSLRENLYFSMNCVGKTIFIGHSMGGHLLLQNPQILKEAAGLILLGTPPLGHPPRFDEAFLPAPGAGSYFVASPEPEMKAALWKSAFGETVSQQVLEKVQRDFDGTDPRFRQHVATGIGGPGFFDECIQVHSLPYSTGFFLGDQDKLISSDYINKNIRPEKKARGQVQILENCGHYPQLEQPGILAEMIHNYVEENKYI